MSAAASPAEESGALGQRPYLTGRCGNGIVVLPDGVAISDWGIDTVSFCWRPDNERLWQHLEEPLERGCLLQGWNAETYELYGSSEVIRGARGSALVKERVAGGRFGYFPRHRLIYCEGRLAALYSGDEQASGLAPPRQLDSAACFAALEFTSLAYPSCIFFEDVFLRRLDLACDVSFVDGDQGLRFLRALAAIDIPRLKRNVWHKGGQVQTIYYRTPSRGSVRLRIYDKATESGSGAAGTRVRLEQQRRFVGAQQPAPALVAKDDLGKMWQGQLQAWEVADDVVVADLNGVQRAVLEAVSEGRLSAFTAERLIGNLFMRGRGIGRDWWAAQGKPHLWGRRSRELRDLGLVVDEDGLRHEDTAQSAELPLGQVLRALRQAWSEQPP